MFLYQKVPILAEQLAYGKVSSHTLTWCGGVPPACHN